MREERRGERREERREMGREERREEKRGTAWLLVFTTSRRLTN